MKECFYDFLKTKLKDVWKIPAMFRFFIILSVSRKEMFSVSINEFLPSSVPVGSQVPVELRLVLNLNR